MLFTPKEVQTADANTYVAELLSYYYIYQDAAEKDIKRVLTEIKQNVGENYARAWEEIIDYWGAIERTNQFETIGKVPEGLPNNNTVAIIILNGRVNEDWSLIPEVEARAQMGLDVANAYTNAYVVTTGGGYRKGKDFSDAAAMGKWLTDHGLAKERLILEEKSTVTWENVEFAYDIITANYPTIDKVVIVSSDYHVARGCLNFHAISLLQHYLHDGRKIDVIANAANHTGKDLNDPIYHTSKKNGLCSGIGIDHKLIPLNVVKTE